MIAKEAGLGGADGNKNDVILILSEKACPTLFFHDTDDFERHAIDFDALSNRVASGKQLGGGRLAQHGDAGKRFVVPRIHKAPLPHIKVPHLLVVGSGPCHGRVGIVAARDDLNVCLKNRGDARNIRTTGGIKQGIGIF